MEGFYMSNEKETITLKDANGNDVTITVDVPSDPQPQVIYETFSLHDLPDNGQQSLEDKK